MSGVSELLVGEMIQVVQLIKPHTFFQTFKRKVLLVVKDQLQRQETQQTQVQPLVGKIPWRRKWELTPIFLPGKSHGQGTWRVPLHGSQKSDTIEPTHTHIHIYF